MFPFKTLLQCIALSSLMALTGVAYAGGATGTLPRALGPFKLRMSAQEFFQVAFVKPQPCQGCLSSETYVSLEAAQVRKVAPSLNTNAGMDFLFLNGQLYRITLGTEAIDIRDVKKDMTTRYGEGKPFELKNGTSYIKWDDTATLVTANYQTATEQVYALNYFDWDLKMERDNLASVAAGQANTR